MRYELLCCHGVIYKNKFYGEAINGDKTDIIDRQIIVAMDKLIRHQADYLVFSGGCTKVLPLEKGESPVSEAKGYQDRALLLFPNHRELILWKTILEERALDSWQNLECSLRLISQMKNEFSWIEIISFGFKEAMFDVFARDMPMNELGFTKPTKLEKNINYFFHQIGEISRNPDPKQTQDNMNDFTEKHRQKYDPNELEKVRLRAKRDVYNLIYTPEFKKTLDLDKIPTRELVALEMQPPFPGLKL